jgi:hypothetical protein
VYIQNRSRDKVSAHERYLGTKPNLQHLRVFGSIAYVHIPKERWEKLDEKAEKCHERAGDCLGPRAHRIFPLWMLHPPDEKLVRKSASSSCPTEMSDLLSSGTCRTSWSTIVEPPGRLSSTEPMPMTTQCCELPTRTGSRLRAVYDRNCARNRVTW